MAFACLLSSCASAPPTRPLEADTAPIAANEDAFPQPYEENEVDTPARPTAPIQPQYPLALRAQGVEGDVEARIVVDAEGHYGGGTLRESTRDEFLLAAREALQRARFHPASRGGRPVASWVTVLIQFRLED